MHTASQTAELKHLRNALSAIAAMQGLTLIAPSLGADADRGHQIGANKAFNQAAAIASDALAASALSACDDAIASVA